MAQTQTSRKGAGGRPNKKRDQPDEYRGKQTSQRWTVGEHLELREKAAAAGLTVTEFIRRSALSQPLVEATPAPTVANDNSGGALEQKVDRLIYEVNAVGVNLMQHIRDDRFGRGHRTQQDWDDLYVSLQHVIAKLTTELS